MAKNKVYPSIFGENRRAKIKVYSLVQGVFFRVSATKKGVELSVSLPRRAGVENPQNLPDGTIEIIAEGEENNLKKFIEWCKTGPESAKVEKIEITKI